MANCCPRACNRLAAAAAFLAIGVVQVIAGMILLRSKYVFLLSGPNFWTASANIAVGSLLGVSATVWKTIDKKTKHTARRNLLAAMASSAIILNGTTAAILIMGESNSLLSIHLESSYSSTTLAKEILAYAYATSVCSPIICIVVSIAFLTGMCFRIKNATKRSLDFKNISREDSTQDYSWVYTSHHTKPDPEIMKTTLSSSSSESGLSSDDSDSYNSSILPVHIRSHTPMNKFRNIHLETSSNRSKFQNHTRKKGCLEATVHSNCSKRGRVSFADESSSEKNRAVFASAKFLNPSRSSSSLDRRKMSALLTYKRAKNSLPDRQMRPRGMPKVLFTEYPSGSTVHRSAISPFVRGEKFLSHTDDLPLPQLKMPNSVNSATSVDANGKMRDLYIVHTSADSPSVYEDAVLKSPDAEVDSVEEFRLHNHEKLQRTSTAEYSKVQKEIELLDDSAIHPDSVFNLRESYPNRNSHQTVNSVKNPSLQSSVLQTSADLVNTSSLEGEAMSAGVKNSNFRSKLSSKLIPVPTPVISDGSRYLTASNRISPGKCKRKLYSKSNKIYHNYNDCNQTGFTSFKGRRQTNEVDTVYTEKHNSSVSKSPMEYIPEFAADETNDTFLPSTSTHTSGYVSTLEDESGDESDVDLALKQRNLEPSVYQNPTGERTVPNSEERSEHILNTNKYRQSVLSRSLRKSFQNVVEEFMKENPDLKAEEISRILQSPVI